MSNAKRRHRRRWRLVRRAIRAEVFRRHWEASGGIDGWVETMFGDARVPDLLMRRSPVLEKLRHRLQEFPTVADADPPWWR